MTGSRTPLLRGLLWAAVVVVIALAIVGAGSARLYWVWSRDALPALDGEARLRGLAAPVVIRRDVVGVPHIQAQGILDAARAQGYVTAQDRLWQMDLMRRRALGELAEAFGEGALRADQEVRTLGLAAAARSSLPRLPEDLRAFVEAYAEGVSAYIESHRETLPVEFRLLRYSPRPWTAADTVATGKLLALDLAQGWESEAFRAVVADKLPSDVQDLLFPSTFPDDRILVGSDTRAPRGAAAGPAETTQGSNNWVVSGAHTASGRPLLANDPHLTLGVPSIWTAVHLAAGDLDVAGVTMPGVPGVILGRNRHVAWGATNVHDDCADLYVEEFDPAHPGRYRVGEGWETVTVRTEPIRVRDGMLSSSWRTVEHPVRVTRHGPLVPVRGRLYALRWTSLDDTPDLSAFLLMNRARSWEEFREGLRLFAGPSQNFVYADADGHIAWYSAGRVPLRRAGDGSRPYRGADAGGDWVGFVPFEELPHLVDPPQGRIVTANSRTVGTDYRYRISRGGIPPWRTATLLAGLEQRAGGWTADDMVRLQGERSSIPHRNLARALLDAAARHKGDPVWDDVMLEMSGWDGRLEPGSRPGALAITAFLALGERVIGPRVQGFPEAQVLRRRTAAIDRLIRERPAGWLPAGAADWDAVLRDTWQDACRQLERRLGGDRTKWTCGALNRLVVHHPLAGAFAPLGRLFDPPVVGMGGASTTPNVFVVNPRGIEAPSMRFVADLADPDATRLVNFMGQSGQPASPYYDNQLEPWVRVESQVFPMTAEAVARAAQHTLRLVP